PASDWTRFNDYGVGLLLQGDTRAAAQAFAEVAKLAPVKADGERNLARVALVDGNLEEARSHLERCEKRAPGNPQTALFWAEYLQRSGDYANALKAYNRVLLYFPQDRQALFQTARTHYLMADF